MALKLEKKAADLQEDNAIVHLSLAEAYRGLKRWSEAESSIKRGLALDPNQPSLITCYKEIQVPILKERGMMLMQESKVDFSPCFCQTLKFYFHTNKLPQRCSCSTDG